MEGCWLYSSCFVGCYFQDLLMTSSSILSQLPSSFFSVYFVSDYMVRPFSYMDTTATWEKFCFILSEGSDLHLTDSLSIAVRTFVRCVLMSFSVDEKWPSRYRTGDIIIIIIIMSGHYHGYPWLFLATLLYYLLLPVGLQCYIPYA